MEEWDGEEEASVGQDWVSLAEGAVKIIASKESSRRIIEQH